MLSGKKACVIVGGGAVGMLTAFMAKKIFNSVYIIEKSPSLGGLLKSFDFNKCIYDYGTHLPALTHIEELNRILYGDKTERTKLYHHFCHLKSENFFNGEWNLTSPLIRAESLSKSLYRKGLLELLTAQGQIDDCRNLKKHLLNNFGETFTNHIYKPILKKLLNADLEILDKNALNLFGLQRLIILSPEITRELKRIPTFDARIGFHSYVEGEPPNPYIYPKGNNGIGFWISNFKRRLEIIGVKILTNVSVEKINYNNGTIHSVQLGSNETIACDHLYWTIPPALALQSAGLSSDLTPPEFRTHVLCNLEFAKPIIKSIPQYLLVWDPNFISYRITLYPNLTEDRRQSKKINLTVEILCGREDFLDQRELLKRVRTELERLNIIGKENRLISYQINTIKNSFPIYTESYISRANTLRSALATEFKNITLLGRSSGESFFMNDNLLDAYFLFNKE
jgi:protoporphyrinogen oxidase